jgi:predicted dehydrogenase
MIRFGIVGFGLHAVRRLMPGFALARNCKVTALSRRDPQKAADAAREYNIPHVFLSTEELCRCPEVDAVFVTTPNALHHPDVLAAVRAGKPILCEKPMGMNANECRDMVEAARAAKVPLGIAQIFRFEPSVNRMRDMIAAGEIGKPVFARSEFSFDGRSHGRTWLYDKTLAGGGPIADIGVHCIDTLRYVLQDEPVRVSTLAHSDAISKDVEAAAVMNFEFRGGALATVLVSMRAPYRTPIEFIGDAGVVRADDGLTVDRPVTVELWREQRLAKSETVSNADVYGQQVDSFADALEGRGAFPIPGEEGWKNQVILDAAFRSLGSGRAEEIRLPG